MIHSLTKYINGHGDAMGGAIIGASALVNQVRTDSLTDLGAVISPFNAWVLLKGLETLGVRVRAQTETAGRIADVLASHPKISRLVYPGRADHP